eukprot:5343367-Prorocentrum_lima.AAC.1
MCIRDSLCHTRPRGSVLFTRAAGSDPAGRYRRREVQGRTRGSGIPHKMARATLFWTFAHRPLDAVFSF